MVSQMTGRQRRGLVSRDQILRLTLGQKLDGKHRLVCGHMKPLVLLGQKSGRAVDANRLQSGATSHRQLRRTTLQT
jgi:hypothetical protein